MGATEFETVNNVDVELVSRKQQAIRLAVQAFLRRNFEEPVLTEAMWAERCDALENELARHGYTVESEPDPE